MQLIFGVYFIIYFILRCYYKSMMGRYFFGDKEFFRFDCVFKYCKNLDI